jgi:hypothetical protein
MSATERAPLLGDAGGRSVFDRVDIDDDIASTSSASASERRRLDDAHLPDDARNDPTTSNGTNQRRKYAYALALSAMCVSSSAFVVASSVAFVRRAAEGPGAGRLARDALSAVGIAPRATEVLSPEALRAYPWLTRTVDGSLDGSENRRGRSDGGGMGDSVGMLGTDETHEFVVEEDPLEQELERNAHALERARTVEDFVAMSVHVDDAHAVGRKPLSEWVHQPSVGGPSESSRLFGDDSFTVCLYNLHRWTRPLGTSTWTEDLSTVLDAKRGMRAAARDNLLGRCVKEVMHTNKMTEGKCLEADVVVFRGDSMIKSLAKLGTPSSAPTPKTNATRHNPAKQSGRKASAATLVEKDFLVTSLPSKARRDQVYVYVSTSAPASLVSGQDLRDQLLLSQVDYLATSNSAIESVWRSPLPTAKFMISSYDAFLRPFHMRIPIIGYGDSATACAHGNSVGSAILRRISKKYPVQAFGTCMHNFDAPWFVPNLALSASSTEMIRSQLRLSQYLFFFVSEEVDCPGHVTEKLWLPLLRGSIPIYFGTKTVEDYLPCPNKDCVLSVKDFDSVDALVARMREIAESPAIYDSLTAWRKELPSNWPERFRNGVASASHDIQSVVCDIMRDGDDARRRDSISNFAAAVPHSAPWLLSSYPNAKIDLSAVADLERSGAKSTRYCLRQDRVRALGRVHATELRHEHQNASSTTTTGSSRSLTDPSLHLTKVCDYEAAACYRLRAFH